MLAAENSVGSKDSLTEKLHGLSASGTEEETGDDRLEDDERDGIDGFSDYVNDRETIIKQYGATALFALTASATQLIKEQEAIVFFISTLSRQTKFFTYGQLSGGVWWPIVRLDHLRQACLPSARDSQNNQSQKLSQGCCRTGEAQSNVANKTVYLLADFFEKEVHKVLARSFGDAHAKGSLDVKDEHLDAFLAHLTKELSQEQAVRVRTVIEGEGNVKVLLQYLARHYGKKKEVKNDGLVQADAELLSQILREHFTISTKSAPLWWESMICRGMQISVSELLADNNFRAVQQVVARAKAFKNDADAKTLLPWAALPRVLFGGHIFNVKEGSVAIADFVGEVEKVWFQVIPEFELKLTRLNGILTSQIRLVNTIQLRVVALVCFFVGWLLHHVVKY